MKKKPKTIDERARNWAARHFPCAKLDVQTWWNTDIAQLAACVYRCGYRAAQRDARKGAKK